MNPPRYGKHRGTVEGNLDPLNQGRLLVKVPSVFGRGATNWAMPCVPYAGPDVGFLFLPPRGAHVWIEFEEGNTQKPIWSGCFWGPTEALSLQPLPIRSVLKTPAFELTITAPPGAAAAAIVEIKHAAGHKISMGPTGITITNGVAKIELLGPAVKINNDGLEVT